MLLARLGLAVILAGILGIVIAFLAAPDIFAAADKSQSDMNFGYLLPFLIPAPVMVILTLPIFALLSKGKTRYSGGGKPALKSFGAWDDMPVCPRIDVMQSCNVGRCEVSLQIVMGWICAKPSGATLGQGVLWWRQV